MVKCPLRVLSGGFESSKLYSGGAMWYRKDIDEVIRGLNSSKNGLSSEEAQARLDLHGPNTLHEKKQKSHFRILMDQFGDFMILVLIGAAVIAGIIGDLSDIIVIMVIVILNAVIGYTGIQGRKSNGGAEKNGCFECDCHSGRNDCFDPGIHTGPREYHFS
jgi:magnesium-transporting ATPase (P-type)